MGGVRGGFGLEALLRGSQFDRELSTPCGLSNWRLAGPKAVVRPSIAAERDDQFADSWISPWVLVVQHLSSIRRRADMKMTRSTRPLECSNEGIKSCFIAMDLNGPALVLDCDA